ncbi:hypothetical protein M885DRAFT_553424 [Pelagophyceae sp. CCMP2097]|nr:hypothetical protein M885DRAFT_553424 [Pelagophyceae sp. CCMP2097]
MAPLHRGGRDGPQRGYYGRQRDAQARPHLLRVDVAPRHVRAARPLSRCAWRLLSRPERRGPLRSRAWSDPRRRTTPAAWLAWPGNEPQLVRGPRKLPAGGLRRRVETAPLAPSLNFPFRKIKSDPYFYGISIVLPFGEAVPARCRRWCRPNRPPWPRATTRTRTTTTPQSRARRTWP